VYIPTTTLTQGGPRKVFDSTLAVDTASLTTGAGAIPTTYDLLTIYVISRTTEVVDLSTVSCIFNNDSSAIYDLQRVRGNNVTANAGQGLAATSLTYLTAGASQQAGAVGVLTFIIPRYAQTIFHKAGSDLNAISDDTAANNYIEAHSFRYRSTTAISQFTITAGSGSLLAGTSMLVYAE